MRKLPLPRAIVLILITTILFSGTATLTFFYYQHLNYLNTHDEKYLIKKIHQVNPLLPTKLCAELLDLSLDKPKNLYLFDKKIAEKKLLKFPLIKDAKVQKIFPDQLNIEYSLRKPIALLEGFSNIAIDKHFHPFPLNPFFSEKKLPIITLGENPTYSHKKLALSLYKLTKKKAEKIDVSKAFSECFGKREIILVLKKDNNIIYLRFSPTHYRQNFANFKKLSLPNQDVIIDFRIPQLAFITKI